MNKRRFLFCLLTLSTLTAIAQSTDSEASGKAVKIPKHHYLAPGSFMGYPAINKTTIHVAADGTGIPVYFWVLRYKGKTIGLYPANYAFYTAMYKITEVAEFPIYKDVFTPEEIVELISTYKYELKDHVIHIRASQSKSKDGKVSTTRLPEYLKFTVEKLSFN
ncbi:hypothetical protein SAMN05192529_11346 [Arachidicoccus rhizosphaerae]|uniref:Uncharacterized protein n=1 Tax=Arachidicoccus rhizosphaerae TaxID=551991 RepID=A0A1H4A4T4_9BACT|nr:hypothetical protein [Arachidicoccus rhizosphaerae]SEA30671.1 hypothetical protein SAMN05192529_11346 [Arachidicoccus rhizosphaerae]